MSQDIAQIHGTWKTFLRNLQIKEKVFFDIISNYSPSRKQETWKLIKLIWRADKNSLIKTWQTKNIWWSDFWNFKKWRNGEWTWTYFTEKMTLFTIRQLQLTRVCSRNKLKTLSAPFCSKWYGKKSLKRFSSG